jgi:Asp-tRNA(Asn)/Glu-tRNA(Gln) amidotransferase A subunit family amidase
MYSSKNTDVASAANLPAITLPTSSMSNKDNMPIGMELATITGYDRKLVAVARSLEKIILGHDQK